MFLILKEPMVKTNRLILQSFLLTLSMFLCFRFLCQTRSSWCRHWSHSTFGKHYDLNSTFAVWSTFIFYTKKNIWCKHWHVVVYMQFYWCELMQYKAPRRPYTTLQRFTVLTASLELRQSDECVRTAFLWAYMLFYMIAIWSNLTRTSGYSNYYVKFWCWSIRSK